LKRFVAVLATAAIGTAAALPTAGHAAPITLTATGSSVVTGSFEFNTVTRAFSNVNLTFAGTVPFFGSPSPFSFNLNSLSAVTVAVNTGGGAGGNVGTADIFGGTAAIPGATLLDPNLNYADSNFLESLANGASAPTAGSAASIDWTIGQFDGDSILGGQLSLEVSFNVTGAATPPGQPNVVPEPATLGLAAGCLLLGAVVTRRRSGAGALPA
jgi:hypothetical protein